VRAAVLDHPPSENPDAKLVINGDLPEPAAGAGEVVIQVRGVGICGSDLALLAGRRHPPRLPWVPGHETVGEIVVTGPGVDAGRIGERVIVEPNFPCFSCDACRTGRTSACPRRTVLGFSAPGTLAERIVVPGLFAWPVPDGWSDADAVCAEPLAVAQAAIRRAGEAAAGRCLVVGAGSQGALACLALVSQGIPTHVLEPNPERLALAADLGATPAADGDVDFDLIFETSGSAPAFSEAARRAAPGGSIIMIGMSADPITVSTQAMVSRQLTARGSLIYDHPGDFSATIRSASSGIRPGRVLQASYPLDEADAAFRAARGVPGKTWIQLRG
jgi:2-desacetyl-2-hydroxyethyl bacteriochlorophyllide A dehydrogenase